MRGRLIQALLFLSSRSSESDKSYKNGCVKRDRRIVKPGTFTDRPPAAILFSFRTQTEVFFDDHLTHKYNRKTVHLLTLTEYFFVGREKLQQKRELFLST